MNSSRMQIGEPVDPRLPWIRSLHDLEAAWQTGASAPRQRAVEQAGKRLGDALREGPRVVSVRTLPTSAAPYPVRFAFNGATPGALLVMQNRSLLVQVRVEGVIKNVLFNPTDGPANQRTPYYAKLIERTPDLLNRAFRPRPNRAAEQLAELGLRCEDIDVVAFDHFHTQDLRPLLGTESIAARFPNAYLLAPRVEWHDWDDLPQCQRAWFVPDGKIGVPSERVVLTHGDLRLGDGALLLQTPGHTSGNQTLFVHAEGGVFGSSENGTSADSWAPLCSRIPGVRRQAQLFDVEVIINANTPELCGQQYISMMLERAMVDRVPGRPDLYQMFPSSEVTPHFIAPHIRPTWLFGAMESGQVVTRSSALNARSLCRQGEPDGISAHPDDRFEKLPDFPFAPHYIDVPAGDGTQLRAHYLDEGPRDGAVVLCMHGEPSWSFLYRTMIPVLTDAGLRVLAPDLIGFGKSDKPVAREAYSYAAHVAWMRAWLEALDLRDITLVCQDWGGLIGLRLVAAMPQRFARVVTANTGLPTGDQRVSDAFHAWRTFSQEVPVFPAGSILQGGTTTQLPDDVVAAYDAPFPDERYKAGARQFPTLVPITPDDPAAQDNRSAWEVLRGFERPFLTAFSDGDPVTRGGAKIFQALVPGAQGQAHVTTQGGHFLQEDCGPELARIVVDFIARTRAGV